MTAKKIITIKPYTLNRNKAYGRVATPWGDVYVKWVYVDDEFNIEIKWPKGVTAKVIYPNNEEQIINSIAFKETKNDKT